MLRIRSSLLVIIFTLVIPIGFIDAAPLQPVDKNDALWYPKTDLTLHPRVKPYVLENGMRYILIQSQSPKDEVEIRLHIRAGSALEKGPQPGVAHFLEHMAFNGSKNIPEGEMITMLQRDGLAFGAHTNAFTDFTQTVYQLSLPSAEEELIEKALFIMRETSSNLTIDKAAVARERGVLNAEVRGKQGPEFNSFLDWIRFAYPGTDYINKIPVGSSQGIKSVTQDILVEFYHRYYTPKRTTLIVTGDFNPERVKKAIQKQFSDWTADESLDEPDFGKLVVNTEISTHAFIDKSIDSRISINVITPAKVEPDSRKKRLGDLLTYLANTALSIRLNDIAINSDNLMTGAAAYQERSELATISSVSSYIDAEQWPSALELIEQSLGQTLEFGFTQKEIDRLVASFEADLKLAVQSEETVPNYVIADSVTQAVENRESVLSAKDNLAFFQKNIVGIKAEQVAEHFRLLWSGAAPSVYLTSNIEIEDAEAAILKVYNQSLNTQVYPLEAREEVEFQYVNFGDKGKVVSEKTNKVSGIKSVQFNNGVVVNVKQTEFDKGQVFISLRVGHGLEDFPADKDGLINLFEYGYQSGGLKKHTFDELHNIFLDKNVSMALGVGLDSLGGTYSTTPDELKLQLQVLTALLTEQAYRSEGESFFRHEIKVSEQMASSSPEHVIDTQFMRTLYGEDKRFGLGPLSEIQQRTFAELRPVIERIMKNGPIEIAIVGDINNQKAISAVAETFGALSQRFKLPSHHYLKGIDFPEPQTVILFHRGGVDTALLNTYWKTDDDRDVKSMRRLQLLQEILTLKLTKKLRESMGVSYSPYAFSTNSDSLDGYGFIGMSSNIKLGDIDKVEAAYKLITDEVKKEGAITDDELLRARAPIIKDVKNAVNSNWFWLDLASQAYSAPARFDRFNQFTQELSAVTVADITQTANRYLVQEREVIVKVLPEKISNSVIKQ